MSGRNAALQKLLDCGASTEAQCFLGQPIHIATWGGNITAMQMFHKANPDVSSSGFVILSVLFLLFLNNFLGV